jgi:hypothetical protein
MITQMILYLILVKQELRCPLNLTTLVKTRLCSSSQNLTALTPPHSLISQEFRFRTLHCIKYMKYKNKYSALTRCVVVTTMIQFITTITLNIRNYYFV